MDDAKVTLLRSIHRLRTKGWTLEEIAERNTMTVAELVELMKEERRGR